MFIKPRPLVLMLLLASLCLLTCKKEEGEGGKCTIKGRVYVKDYNGTFTTLIGEYWAQREDVFIIYGDHTTIDDKVETNYDGTYEFRYLRPGDYTVYAYSKDSTLNTVKYPSGEYPVLMKVHVSKKQKTADVPVITIFN